MMEILLFSDSHGSSHDMHEAILRHPGVQTVCHLGDGVREAAALQDAFPHLTVYAVRGNCDMGCELPYTREEILGGRHILLTHGHLFHVKSGLYTYACAARERAADIALFGHTHQPFADYADGIYLFNPGSIRDGCYGKLTISAAGVLTENLKIR